MKKRTPVLDSRDQSDLLAELRANVRGYTPEWLPKAGTAGSALMHIFARYMEIFITGLNQVPDRSFLAFLDMLGTRLLPAQSARAPLVFTLMDNSPVDPILAANSQVAAPAAPQPPSPLLAGEVKAEESEAAVFATTQTLTLSRAKLAALYSIRPETDEYADHTNDLTKGFTLFDDLRPVEHAIYLGQNSLFALAGVADVSLVFNMGPGNPATVIRNLEIEWEYLSKDGWLPLKVMEDKTEGFTRSGAVLLRKSCGPDAKEETINGHTSFWLRGLLRTPLAPKGSIGVGEVPIIDTVRARVSFTKADLLPEAALTDTRPLDTTNNFFPFGQQPARYTTFYLASKETFQRRGARVRIDVKMSEKGTPKAGLNLAWEYYDGNVWRNFQGLEFIDGTEDFSKNGNISFLCPLDWSETIVNGQKNYWMRVRIDDGNYGEPFHLTIGAVNNSTNVEAVESTLEPPVISSLKLQYTYQTNPSAMDHCLTFNDFVFADHSHSCRWPRQTFEPFVPLTDRQPGVYFGFDHALPSGLVSLYLHIPPGGAGDESAGEASSFIWEYLSARGWTELGVLDETLGFRRSGMLQLVGQRDAVAVAGVGGNLYRLRARLKQGESLASATVAGVWLNAAWATHRLAVTGDALGTSDGNPDQTFYFLHQRVPVLEGELIEIREWSGRGADWETTIRDVPEQDLRLERELVTNAVKAVWVRWHERPHLFGSAPTGRHYVIERAIGALRFGDGGHGMIPPAGSRISATYSSGGGLTGNVPAGAITELRTGVPYLKEVSNPVAATGGSVNETLQAVRARGPQRVRHKDRAVSASDFEWMAHESSSAIARARCLPITGSIGRGQLGWVTVIVMPYSTDALPSPTPELCRRVEDHLAARVPATISRHVHIIAPTYMPVGVIADVVPLRPEESAQVEARVLLRLNKFLHPLAGGPDDRGWSFGQPLYLSQIAALIENTKGVDYALKIGLRVNGQVFDEHVPVDSNSLIAAGDHEIKLMLGEN